MIKPCLWPQIEFFSPPEAKNPSVFSRFSNNLSPWPASVFWKFLKWDSCALSGGPKCLPGSRSYLTILRTLAEPQVTLDVAGRTEFLTDTWAPAPLWLNQPAPSPAMTVRWWELMDSQSEGGLCLSLPMDLGPLLLLTPFCICQNALSPSLGEIC